jgi:hypothetical protein
VFTREPSHVVPLAPPAWFTHNGENRDSDIGQDVQLPDAFEDDWIDAVLKDRSAVQHFSQRVDRTKSPMELRYLRDVADDNGLDWEYTEKVLSSRDIDDWMRKGW